MPPIQDLEKDIAEAYSHARDVTLRDAIQSKLANRLRNKHIFKIAEALAPLPALVEAHGFTPAPMEAWGGGQVLQPANFLKEDPFYNLQQLHKIAPNVKLQCLNRGRQAWGFGPVSDEVLEAGLRAASDRGLKVVRVFDMMNDMRNLEATFKAAREINKTRPADDQLLVEGAVSYNSEPQEGERAWSLDKYADYAVRLASMGADEIVIKNYAGTGAYEMVELVKKTRAALDKVGYHDKPLNLHMHGPYAALMADVLDAGADKVDVATGALSGGPSFTNVIEFIKERLKRKGYDTQATGFNEIFEHDPIIRQIRHAEEVIAAELAVQQQEAPIAAMKEFSEQEIEKYRMAAGALSDVWARIMGMRDKNEEVPTVKIGKVVLKGKEELNLLFERVLERAAELWEVGGRFNTVTPGAKIACDQALALTMIELGGSPEEGKKLPAYKPLSSFKMQNFIGPYIDIVTGRFGINSGMEKAVGKADVKLRDAFLMYRALCKVNAAFKEGKLSEVQMCSLAKAADIGKDGHRLILKSDGFDLGDDYLQAVLHETNIADFRSAIQHIKMERGLKVELLYELTTQRSADPKDGIAEGRAIVAALPHNLKALHAAGAPISDAKTAAVMAMLFRQAAPNGGAPNDNIFKALVAEVARQHSEKSHAETLGPRTGFSSERK